MASMAAINLREAQANERIDAVKAKFELAAKQFKVDFKFSDKPKRTRDMNFNRVLQLEYLAEVLETLYAMSGAEPESADAEVTPELEAEAQSEEVLAELQSESADAEEVALTEAEAEERPEETEAEIIPGDTPEEATAVPVPVKPKSKRRK